MIGLGRRSGPWGISAKKSKTINEKSIFPRKTNPKQSWKIMICSKDSDTNGWAPFGLHRYTYEKIRFSTIFRDCLAICLAKKLDCLATFWFCLAEIPWGAERRPRPIIWYHFQV